MRQDKEASRVAVHVSHAPQATPERTTSSPASAHQIAWMAGSYFRILAAQGIPHDKAHDHVLQCLVERHGYDADCGDAGCALRNLNADVPLPFCDHQTGTQVPIARTQPDLSPRLFRLITVLLVGALICLLAGVVIAGLRI